MATQLPLPGLAAGRLTPQPPRIALTILGSEGLEGDVVQEGGWFIARPVTAPASHHGTLASALDALVTAHNRRSTPYP